MIIYPYIPKRKPRKPNAKQRAQKASWQALLAKYDIKPTVSKSITVATNNSPRIVVDPSRRTDHIPSLDSGIGVATKKPVMQYTGDKMLGIATMHKSNSVPVFSSEEAINISKMRRN
jgi:hypothetical protein